MPPSVHDVPTDPVEATVALVCAADPSLAATTVADAVTTVAPRRVATRRLANGLSARPGVLADGRSPAPRVIGDLMVELRKRGAAAISAPRCAGCDKAMRSFQRRGQRWYCSGCARVPLACAGCGSVRQVASIDREGKPRCSSCPPRGEDPVAIITRVLRGVDPALDRGAVVAAVSAVTSREGQRRQLAWALQDRPDLLTGAGAEAPTPSVLRLIDKLVESGSTKVIPPACPHCGRVMRLSKVRAGLRICRRCESRQRCVPCGRCGAVRDPVTRDDEGRPICANCFMRDPANQEACAGCGRRRPVSVRRDDGPRCDSCRPKKEMTCSICGRHSVCEIAKATGEPWCRACQHRWATCTACGRDRPVRGGSLERPLCATCTRSDPSFWKPCGECGEATKLTDGPCARCRLQRRLSELLAGPGGAVRPELQPLFDSLITERPESVQGWLRRSQVSETLAELGAGLVPVSHDSLDRLESGKVLEHLRAMLVATGALPARDEQMIRLERWVTTVIAERDDPEQAEILRRYGVWHLVRRLRRRLRGADTTYGQSVTVKRRIRAAIALMDWLEGRGLTLASAGQGDLDAWLTARDGPRSRDAGNFVRWASAAKLTRLELPAVRWAGPTGAIDADRRWEQARRLLIETTIAPGDRVAGLLVLLYAQRASTISRLTVDHVLHSDDGTVRLRLADRPIVVPEPLGELLLGLLASRKGHAVLGDTGTAPWLFPGGQPGRPMSASRITERLRDLGIHAGPARTAALLQLAAELPAAVIARLLGLHIKVAVEWQRASSGDWVDYAADYSRRGAPR